MARKQTDRTDGNSDPYVPQRRESRDVMIVCSDLKVGGTESQLAAIATALARRGWQVSVYSLAGRGPLQFLFEEGGVKVILPPFDRPPAESFRISRIIALGFASLYLAIVLLRRRPTIVHFMLPEAYLVGAPIAKAARIPVKIMSRRSLNHYQRSILMRKTEHRFHRWMNAILGNSRSVIAQLKSEGVPPDRLGLIYNGIALEAFDNLEQRASVRASLGIGPNTFVMSMVANLIPYKGHGDLIDALALVAKKIPADWRLLLAGRDDGIGTILRERAQQCDLAENILFLGLRSDIPALLAASDVGILCSHQEGFANAILEGMAARLPMIVTDVGGNSEAVINDVTGLVVPAKSPERLAEAIEKLANNLSLRRAQGAAGWQRVTERFGMERCVAAHEQLYRRLVAGETPGDIPELRVR